MLYVAVCVTLDNKFLSDIITMLRGVADIVRAHFFCVCARLRLVRTCLCTYLYEHFLVVHCHLISLRIKFHKDPTISCKGIPLFVTFYIFENEKKVNNKNFRLFGTPSKICFYLFFIRYLSLKKTKGFRKFGEKMSPGEAPL